MFIRIWQVIRDAMCGHRMMWAETTDAWGEASWVFLSLSLFAVIYSFHWVQCWRLIKESAGELIHQKRELFLAQIIVQQSARSATWLHSESHSFAWFTQRLFVLLTHRRGWAFVKVALALHTHTACTTLYFKYPHPHLSHSHPASSLSQLTQLIQLTTGNLHL